MDVGAASAVSSYRYQTALQSGTQSQAVLQALTQAYGASSAANGGADALASLAGASNLGPLVSAIYSQAQAGQPAGSAASVPGLQAAASYGGLDSGSATSLLATLAADPSGLGGFGAALDSRATLALTAYQAKDAYENKAVAAPPAGSAPAVVNAYVQQVLQAAQTSTGATTFSLLS